MPDDLELRRDRELLPVREWVTGRDWTVESLEKLLLYVERVTGMSHEEMTDFLEDFLRRHRH